jgi:tRNA(Ile)-lysidine synthase
LRRVEPALRAALRGPCRLPPQSRLLVAVSGGADSTALLVGLHRIAKEFDVRLVAAHLHHGLRGEEADRDEQHVRRLCRALRIPLLSARWDTRARMRRRGLSGQDGLRRLRREFLLAAADRGRAVWIATGHHADDQLETLLARLLRGAGLQGLGGMSPRQGRWLKPLLAVARRDIEADLERAGVSWREDSSNRGPHYLRNRLRNEAIPALLAAAGDASQRARARLAHRVAASLGEIRQARRLVERPARALAAGEAVGVLNLDRLAQASPVVRKAALRLAWARLRTGLGLTARHLGGLEALARGRAAGPVSLPAGWKASRQGRLLHFGRPKAQVTVNKTDNHRRRPWRTTATGLRVAAPSRSDERRR